jgi:hypothetical protein
MSASGRCWARVAKPLSSSLSVLANTGELTGSGKPRGQVLAIGYDPDRSAFPPSEHEAPDICAAQLELHGRYLMVEDNGRCGGLNVSFTGLYVRVAN